MFKKQLLILLLIFWAQNSSCFIDDLIALVKMGWSLAQFVNDITFTKDTATGIASSFTGADDHQEIIGKLNEINNKLDDLKSSMSDQQNYIALLIQQLPSEIEIQTKKDRLVSVILTANRLWDDLTSYMKHDGTVNMLNDLADDILGNLKSQLQEFRQILTPLPGTGVSEHHGLFFLIVENADKKRDILCDQSETSHHSVMRVLHIAIATEVKAQILLSFANRQKYSKNDGWKVPLETQFKEQFERCLSAVSRSLKIAKLPYIRSCDPDVWRTDDNYYGLYGFHQRTVYRIVDNNYDPDVRTRLTCSELNRISGVTSSHAFDNGLAVSINDHSKCSGRPFNCEYRQPAFRDFISCAWDKGPYKIRFVQYEGEIFGTDKEAMKHLEETDDLTCPQQNAFNLRWYQGSRSEERECICQCPTSNVKLAVRDMMISRVDDNFVIVGLRIHKVNDYIYIQIAEGKLEANGHISESSWVPATRSPKPDPRSSYVDPAYAATKWLNIFMFGDLQLPPGFVLTGIQFCWFFLNPAVFSVRFSGHEFNYDTGRLNPRNISKHQLGHAGKFGREFTFPTKTPINKVAHGRSTPKSDGYTHVRLQISDTSDDFGQTTLPLLDGVPILTNPLSPIGGVGLFYKGDTGDYAGFLSLRIYPLNYTYLMDTLRNSPSVKSMFNANN